MLKKSAILMIIMSFILVGCGDNGSLNGSSSIDGKIKITTTTGMITDIVKHVGGDYVVVTGLMGPGVDPHLYKASQGDMKKLKEANIIFYNGLLLEGKMSDVFIKMARDKPALAVSDYIDTSSLREPPEFNGHFDPHIWFDVSLWMKAVERVRDGLIEFDPTHRAEYEQNAKAYLQQLEELDQYVRTQIMSIPVEGRVLVTAHDAFGYFGDAYGIEVIGLQGISTDTEYGLHDVSSLVDLLVDRRIKAVFIESSIPRRSIDAVVQGAKAKGHEVIIGGELYSDAMGDEGTEEGTYIGMVKHNVDTIVSALK